MFRADGLHAAHKTAIPADLVPRELCCGECGRTPVWYVRIFHAPTSAAITRCVRCNRFREASPCAVCVHDGHADCTDACKANCDGCGGNVHCDDHGTIMRMCGGCVDAVAASAEPIAAWARRISAVQNASAASAAHPVSRGLPGKGKSVTLRMLGK